MSGSPAWHLAASGARQSHPLSPALSGVNSSYFEEEEEEMSLLPPPGTLRNMFMACVRTASFDNAVHTFQVALFKPPDPAALEGGQPRTGRLGGAGDGSSSGGSSQSDEPFFTVQDVLPSKATSEWLVVGLTLLPKISWGWLPFCFTFLGFSPALKLLLFITLFSVYSAAILYRLYLHSDRQGKMSLADIGEAAFGRRLGRRPVLFFTRAITLCLPSIMHTWLFYTFPVCLPWISLIFGLIVLALVQIQGLGRHPALVRVVQPVLTGLAIGATLLKLSLMHAQQQRAPAAALNAAPDPTESANPAYLSDYVIAVVQLISANYMGQHIFLEEMTRMESPATFQHSTAWAQIITLLANLGVAVATLRVQQSLPHVRGFISFALGSDFLSRFISFTMWILMTVKYVIVLHQSTKALLPRLPHLLVKMFDPDEVDSRPMHLQPRQLWFICSLVVVVGSFLVSCTFPHTFMYLSGLLVSLAYIPCAFTLPCLFSLKLLSNKLTALEYTLSSWVVPVSVIMSLLGCWASGYQLFAKWNSAAHGGSWGCNLLQPL
ncbi:hypothetical protein COHA_008359 [Chlorella ohadii]|uniref:Amino acid transporter transmembrane domain-containing protein n=1 Tax=Chlorella ohadii TaxID=2649997 RepID=A0AAD5DGZ6_9CHLO|nr:hypothetical protein COHA_008359 [Chlorella ohadii]